MKVTALDESCYAWGMNSSVSRGKGDVDKTVKLARKLRQCNLMIFLTELSKEQRHEKDCLRRLVR